MIMSLLTNILVDAIGEECSGGEGALNAALTRIFTQAGGVFGFCQAYPGLRFFIAPPSVREKPSWYPRFRPVILRALHQVFLSRPQNLQLLEDYPGVLDTDGIHYNIMSGVNFATRLLS